MNTMKAIILLLTILFLRVNCEDLMDKYVRHVGSVNQIDAPAKVKNLNNKLQSQRSKRSLYGEFLKQTNERDVTVTEISGNDKKNQISSVKNSDKTNSVVSSFRMPNERYKSKRFYLSKKYLKPTSARRNKLDHFWSQQENNYQKMRFRTGKQKRSVNFAIDPLSNNGFEKNGRRKPKQHKSRHQQQKKKIVSDFTPDLKPYLEDLHREVAGNELDDTQEKFRRKRSAVERKKRDESDLNQWTHAAVLDERGDVVLRWQPRHMEILFRVEARTLGYIGIGFSPDGGMEGADIVVGWVDKYGKPFLNDYHGSKDQGSEPVKDELDNYTLMRGEQNDTHTAMEFRRALDTCDPDDYVLGPDTVRVIWAMHPKDPDHNGRNGLVYHGEMRGTQSLHLLGPRPPKKTEDSAYVRNWDVTLNNFEVKNDMDTVYWCKIFKAPVLHGKHHIVGYEPIIGKNHTKLVHHMLLHECQLDDNENLDKWDAYAREDGRPCYEDNGLEWEKCLTPVVAWAIGSKGEEFPNHVGIPLAEKRRSYYRLEVHFDNPTMKRSVSTSGLRVRYTSKLRPNDGGILVTGITLSPLHIIPPRQAEYRSAGYCDTGCTEKMFPKDGINVISVLLHSHLAGRKLKLRHIRGDQELPPIAEDNHYNFNYQQSRALSQEIKVLPGDGLVTECTYNTSMRKRITFGGYSTQQEMCLAFVLHYPRTELAGCYSMPPVIYFFNTLGVKKFYGKEMAEVDKIILHGSTDTAVSTSSPNTPLFHNNPGDEHSKEANERAIQALQNARDYTIETQGATSNNILDQLIIETPKEFSNKTFMSHLEALPYSDSAFSKNMEKYFYTGLHLVFCRKRDDTLAMPEKPVTFPEFKPYYSNETKVQCSYRMRNFPNMPMRNSASRVSASILLLLFITFLY